MAFAIPYALLAQGIYTGIITTISTITTGTCYIVTSIYTHKNPNVSAYIKELDIERRLKLIEAVLHTIKQTKPNETFIPSAPPLVEPAVVLNQQIKKLSIDNQTVEYFLFDDYQKKPEDPIQLCLRYLSDIIYEIHKNLSTIHEKVSNHNDKWFSAWRSLHIKKDLESLKINSLILNMRFGDLIEISKFLTTH